MDSLWRRAKVQHESSQVLAGPYVLFGESGIRIRYPGIPPVARRKKLKSKTDSMPLIPHYHNRLEVTSQTITGQQ